MAGAGLFGTYFLPWFDLGDNVVGGVGDYDSCRKRFDRSGARC